MDHLKFLLFNDNKTEVLYFRASSVSPFIDLDPLAQYLKGTVTSPGVKMDGYFNLDRQTTSVVTSSFYHLRQLTCTFKKSTS